MSTSSLDPVAAFLAKGGSIRRVPTGASSGISDRQFYLASRGDISLKGPSENDLIEQRHTDGAGVVRNGLGEIIGRV
jgi:hypothetical protein